MIDRYLKITDYEILMRRIYRKPVPATDLWGVDTFYRLCKREMGYNVAGSREEDIQKIRDYWNQAGAQLASYAGVDDQMKKRFSRLTKQLTQASHTDEMYRIISQALELTYPYRELSGELLKK